MNPIESENSINTSVFDVARYILHVKGQMSTMKLQKLCYYAQAWSLVWDDRPLFNEEFRAWEMDLFAGSFLMKHEECF